MEAKLLPLLETDLSKNATLKANIEVIENFYNVQQPLYARVDSVICFKQDSGMLVNESLSKLEILLKSSELNTLTYDQLFKVFAFNSLTNKELKTRLSIIYDTLMNPAVSKREFIEKVNLEC